MNTTPKRYELLKDICGPIWNFKAGSIFEKFGLSADSAYTCLNLCLHPDYVEKKPEWFREIKENKQSIAIVDCEFDLVEGWLKMYFKGDAEISAAKYTKIKEYTEKILNNE